MRYIMCFSLGMLVLVLGLGNINIHHFLNLPEMDKNKIVQTTHFKLNLVSVGFYKKTDIRLNDEIQGLDTVKEVVRVLSEAKEGDEIVFHMAGYGGNVDSTLDIINNIKASKARVVMVVEAPVFSGHAYLSVSGDELIVLPYAFLMFHTSSLYGYDCDQEEGLDRTHPKSEKCKANYQASMYLINKLIDSIKYLTEDEKQSLKNGNDIYLFADGKTSIRSDSFYKTKFIPIRMCVL